MAASVALAHNVNRDDDSSDTVDESSSLNIEMKHDEEEEEEQELAVMDGCVDACQDNFKPTDVDSMTTTTEAEPAVSFIFTHTQTQCL